MRLAELPVLVVDCQATSPNPADGHLLEIAWSTVKASGEKGRIETRLSRIPPGAALPARVARVTGLTEAEAREGELPDTIWSELLAAAEAVEGEGDAHPCPAVIHFASFEERHLRSLHYRLRGAAPFPLQILCTHAIARRVLPGLPRLGLRAVAGYFGHGLSERRRSGEHVAATAAVWKGVVELLEREHGVESLDELVAWLRSPRGGGAGPRRSFPMPQRLREGLPRKPGLYRMLRESGGVLYVGKATVLEDRVRSYFQPSASHPDHVLEMLSQARDLELVVTGSALEAALLEAEEIPRLDPPYNRALRARERKLLFASRSLDRFAEAGDADHPVGPLGGGETLWRDFAALAARVEERGSRFPEGFLASEATELEAGFEMLRRRLEAPSLPALLAHGAREWRREPEEDDSELQLRIQYRRGARRPATAEAVCESMNELVRRASHLVRRSHWLTLVSESTLCWRARGEERIALVLERGAVGGRRSLEDDSPVPEPPGWRRPPLERKRGLDLGAYDRLTVLTREIRRLVDDGREIAIHVGGARRLGREKLARMLPWV